MMKEIEIMKKLVVDELGKERIFCYYLLVEVVDIPGISCENYGVLVEERDGESVRVPRITTSYLRIRGLLGLICEHEVSPIGLQDVVDDWL